MDLRNQKIVIMGGTSGIGLAAALAAAAAGAEVIVTGRDPDKLKRAVGALPASARGAVVDAMSPEALRDFFGRLAEIDHLVLSMSGKGGGGPFRSLTKDALRQAFEAKFFAYFSALQYGVPALKKTGSVALVTAGSARSPYVGTSGLAAVNGALEAMVPALALELKPLRVNAVSPGIIDTPWWDGLPQEQREATFDRIAASTPVGRVGQPEDLAHAIVFLLENTYMTGTVIECDGGMRIK